MLLELCYVYIPTFIAIIGIFILKDRLPEAICCCLQTCSVDVVLLVMCCMCIPVSLSLVLQLWVYFM